MQQLDNYVSSKILSERSPENETNHWNGHSNNYYRKSSYESWEEMWKIIEAECDCSLEAKVRGDGCSVCDLWIAQGVKGYRDGIQEG